MSNSDAQDLWEDGAFHYTFPNNAPDDPLKQYMRASTSSSILKACKLAKAALK